MKNAFRCGTVEGDRHPLKTIIWQASLDSRGHAAPAKRWAAFTHAMVYHMNTLEVQNRSFAFAGVFCTLMVCILSGTILSGCATFTPRPVNEEPIHRHAVSQTENGVRVSAAVLGSKETETVFNLQLYRKGIQPIWLEIENQTPYRMWFPQASVDRNYFSPLEVAYMYHSGYSRASRQRMDRFFHQHAIRNPIDPGTVRSGFVFTNLELGTKAFNVEVVGGDHRVRALLF